MIEHIHACFLIILCGAGAYVLLEDVFDSLFDHEEDGPEWHDL